MTVFYGPETAATRTCEHGKPGDEYCSGCAVLDIRARRYECFIEDHEPLPWTPGRCADYAGRGLHLMRCKRKSGHGLGALFCRQHAEHYPARSSCDVCGATDRPTATVIAYGIETNACDKCRDRGPR